MKPETKIAALQAAAANGLTAFVLIAKKPNGRKLYSFVQLHESLDAARKRATRTLAESGLVLVDVIDLDAVADSADEVFPGGLRDWN